MKVYVVLCPPDDIFVTTDKQRALRVKNATRGMFWETELEGGDSDDVRTGVT